jgi:type IX secretion system PorP/SprF family membrane protein
MKQLTLIVTISCAFLSTAQDIHYSQFWMNNIQYNSSLAGGIDGSLRASASYKNQWPFNTYSVSVDTKTKPSKNGSLGIGMFFFRDVAGDNRFASSEGKIVVSSLLNIAEKQKVSIGVGGGFIQKNLERMNGSWNEQYTNGSYDPSLPNYEAINTANSFKGDLSIGTTYFYGLSDADQTKQEPFQLTLGFSVNHLLTPSLQNYTFNEDRLYRNFILHGDAQIQLAKTNLTLIPAYFMQFQGPSSEIVLGSQYRYAFNQSSELSAAKKNTFLSLGTFLRLKDAFITSVGFQFDNYNVGISYDWNINTSKQVNGRSGAFEINLLYRMNSSIPNPSSN